MRELHRIVRNPMLDGDALERLTGESQLRPANLFPSSEEDGGLGGLD